MHGRGSMATDPRIPTKPGPSTPGFHRPGKQCRQQVGGGGVMKTPKTVNRIPLGIIFTQGLQSRLVPPTSLVPNSRSIAAIGNTQPSGGGGDENAENETLKDPWTANTAWDTHGPNEKR